jgi:pyridoxine 5-phosphate synthase
VVPERRLEITTEGGLDVAGQSDRLEPIVRRLKEADIAVSLFIDPALRQIEAAADMEADYVEIHTGTYANHADADLVRAMGGGKPLKLGESAAAELQRIREVIKAARALGLKPNAGHGLNYRNVGPIAAIPGIQWLHIGHSIVARAVAVGMGRAVSEMLALVKPRRTGSSRAGRVRAAKAVHR